MAQEIEKKYLILTDEWRGLPHDFSAEITQGYIPEQESKVKAGPSNEDELFVATFFENFYNQVLVCDFPGFTRRQKPSPWQPYAYLWKIRQALAAESFDMAIILRFDHWWGDWLTALAGIPYRVGYAQAETLPFLSHALTYHRAQHEVLQNWQLLAFALNLAADASPGSLTFPLVVTAREP